LFEEAAVNIYTRNGSLSHFESRTDDASVQNLTKQAIRHSKVREHCSRFPNEYYEYSNAMQQLSHRRNCGFYTI